MRRRIKEPQKRASTTASDEQIEHGPCIEAEAGHLITSQTLLLLPTCFIMPRISSADKFSVRLIRHRRGETIEIDDKGPGQRERLLVVYWSIFHLFRNNRPATEMNEFQFLENGAWLLVST